MNTNAFRAGRPVLLAVAVCSAAAGGCQGIKDRLAAKRPVSRPAQAGAAQAGAAPRVEFTEEQSFDVRLALARTVEQQGDLERAEAAYRELLRARPKHPGAAHRLAVVLDRQGRFDESAEFFRIAEAAAASDPTLLTDLGYSLYRQGRTAEAERALRRAIAVRPGDRRARNHLGLVLCQAGRRDEALAEFRKAGCSEAEARMNAAVVLTVNDRYEEAREELVLAAGVEPKSRAAAGARRLDGLLAEAGAGRPGGDGAEAADVRQASGTETGPGGAVRVSAEATPDGASRRPATPADASPVGYRRPLAGVKP